VYNEYPSATQSEKEVLQEMVFTYYYDRNEMDFDLAIAEIQEDLYFLEKSEEYERCLMLKDIIERFE
jgi:hypothetical protein